MSLTPPPGHPTSNFSFVQLKPYFEPLLSVYLPPNPPSKSAVKLDGKICKMITTLGEKKSQMLINFFKKKKNYQPFSNTPYNDFQNQR